jgi:hypothetical protein
VLFITLLIFSINKDIKHKYNSAMVFIYQVTQGNRSNKVSFYYVRKDTPPTPTKFATDINASMRKKVRAGTVLVPGMVLGTNGQVICSPPNKTTTVVTLEDTEDDTSTPVSDTPAPEELPHYTLHDGTAVFLYWNKGVMMMATANSWDISRMSDFVKGTSYYDYFAQTCKQVGFDYDALDHSKMHNILFVNPQIHFTENCFRIIHYTDTIQAYPDIAEVGDTTEYMTYDPVAHIITAHMSSAYESLLRSLYNNRRACISSNWTQSVQNILEKWRVENVLDSVISELNDQVLDIISDNEV